MAIFCGYPLLPLLFVLLSVLSLSNSQSSEEGKSKEEEAEVFAGFLMYRYTNENANATTAQYLMLKGAGSDVWNPPMVKWEGRGTGVQVEAAVKATREETGLVVNTDYIAFTGREDQVFFQYETKDEILNRVYLWPARLLTFEKPIQLSAKHSEYAWMEYDEAQERINTRFRTGLTLGNGIISNYVSKFVPYSFYNSVVG